MYVQYSVCARAMLLIIYQGVALKTAGTEVCMYSLLLLTVGKKTAALMQLGKNSSHTVVDSVHRGQREVNKKEFLVQNI